MHLFWNGPCNLWARENGIKHVHEIESAGPFQEIGLPCFFVCSSTYPIFGRFRK